MIGTVRTEDKSENAIKKRLVVAYKQARQFE